LPKYLNQTVKLETGTVRKVLNIMHGVFRLHTVRQWEKAQKKMKQEMEELPVHFWSYYFPETPSFGFASKPAGLVQSTKGDYLHGIFGGFSQDGRIRRIFRVIIAGYANKIPYIPSHPVSSTLQIAGS
jgi:hypothetical protein